MKKAFAVIFSIFIIAAVFAGCSEKEEKTPEKTAEVMPTVLNTAEYTLYQNIFFNDLASDYAGKEVTKNGTFTALSDSYSDVTRYYVWGYNDQTKCCDWQWEIKIDDTSNLPKNGSLVEVSGTFNYSDDALDKYWIENPKITVSQEYNPDKCDVNMLTMSATLERVQYTSVTTFPEKYEGKTFAFYGRVASLNSIQHPYYDGVWEQEIETKQTLPAIGTNVIVKGTVEGGAFKNCTVEETSDY